VQSPSVRSRLALAVDSARETSYARWRELVAARPHLALAEEFVRRWTAVNGSVLAGHLAYRVFLFMVPFALLLVGGLGFASSSGVDVEDGSERVRLGQAIASVMASAGDQAQSSHIQLLIFGTFGTLVACFGLLKALQIVFAQSWGTEVPRTGRFGLLWRLLAGTLLLVASIGLRQWLNRSNIVLTMTVGMVAVAINAGLVLGLSWLLPRRTSRFVDLVPGALVGGIAFAGLHIAGIVYFPDRIARASSLYGSFGVVLVVLLYLFLVGQILVFSAVANSVWYDRNRLLDEVHT
jgi:uncharacterized BrkB/YihY/UPF0761 family membrane protein